jgi:translation elongation factor EF-1alpha
VQIDRVERDGRDIALIHGNGSKGWGEQVTDLIGMADVAVVILSAVPEEFELHDYGIEGCLDDVTASVAGQGIKTVVFAINKMDHAEVGYSQDKYEEIREIIEGGFSRLGATGITSIFVPVSGEQDQNINSPSESMPWYKEGDLMTILSGLRPPLDSDATSSSSFKMAIRSFSPAGGVGTAVFGKIASGRVKAGNDLRMCPSNTKTTVSRITQQDRRVQDAGPGDFVTLLLRNVHQENRIISANSYLVERGGCSETTSIIVEMTGLRGLQIPKMFSWTAMFYFPSFSGEMTVEGVCLDRYCERVQSEGFIFGKGDTVVMKVTTETPYPFSTEARSGLFFILREDGRTIARGTVEKLING